MRWQVALAGCALLTPALILLYHTSYATSKRPPVAIPTASKGTRNLRAFLLTIQYAEGTYGANAYRTLYGGGLFYSYATHPATAIRRNGITSTAAGAYQFLYSTWTALQQALQLPDFSPASQDRAAVELIRRKGALEDVLAGRITGAIYKCRKVWASFPGAGYGQGERPLSSLLNAYQRFGGTITN
ncbi:glycoside hydrolase family 104 protein [Chitinophaga polysaccharea]|uniref:glycoside hydrolase family 24 protein n=1 Tax=Chitinophaga polysaccharea TaxID=1293035 RepID=UPI00145547D2|nr:glycoside hydrolase family 104 protein [Chitinophaga polysaccharea]NLR58829.1 glycoside hydrolase family 104 protein [Chitinophaga polysaccharea]